MKMKGLNRKGQQIVSDFGIGGIIVIVFLVVVVLAIWYVNTRATDIGGQIPENSEVIAQACSLAASESTINSYCIQLREAQSNVYTTCSYAKKYNIIVTDSDGSTASIDSMNEKCEQYSSQLNSKIISECTSGEFKGKSSVEINGKTCSQYISSITCEKKSDAKKCSDFTTSACPSSYCLWNSSRSTCSDRSNLTACSSLTTASLCSSREDCLIKS